MLVEIDTSGLRRAGRDFERQLAALGRDVLAVCQDAAEQEKTTSTYQNRTGVLRGKTAAVASSMSRNGWVIVLRMGAFYGVFVQLRGFSDFTEIGNATIRKVDALVKSYG